MLGPLARRRAAWGGALLLSAGTGSVLLALGAGSATAAAGPSLRPFGPAAVAPPSRPLLRTDGPLLPQAVMAPLTRTARTPGPVGLAPRPPVGPSSLVVGPGSPPRQVRDVQRRLNAHGAALRVDGAWGPATTRAVRAAQARAGLAVDGRVGPATAAALGD